MGQQLGSDNTILYGQSNQQGAAKSNAGIWRVSGGGGTPEHLVKLETGEVAESPQMLPGGRAILFTVSRLDDWDTARIVVQSLDTNASGSARAWYWRPICADGASRLRH